ncbi:hypothetical protein HPB51_013447 [Rhipicephalus microplus]|uniref:Uncharacterized protein n=1 Tax=Rhipicephalus microplus TaxID=6941 RepID=A0A9J6ET07_RHIMP|nr:hypothetical protein HPB51_013447 [Rhipicephalus microplus]
MPRLHRTTPAALRRLRSSGTATIYRLTFVMDVELSAIVLMFARHRRRKCAAVVLSMMPGTITNASRHVPCAGGHMMADKFGQYQFQVLYWVRRRRLRRKAAKKRRQHQEGLTPRHSSVALTSRMRSPSPAVERSRSCSKGVTRSKKHAHSKRRHSKGRSHSRLRFQEAPKTWADRGKPSLAQLPAQVTHVALPEQKEDPRLAFLLQENANLKAQLQQMRVQFEALKNTAQVPVWSSLVEPRLDKRKMGTEKEVVAASDPDVLGAIKDIQKVVPMQADRFELVACTVDMIESRLATGGNFFVLVMPVSSFPLRAPESLGSDHFILAVLQETRAAPPKEYRVTDWEKFRKRRKVDETEYATLEELFSRHAEDALLATKTVQTELQTFYKNWPKGGQKAVQMDRQKPSGCLRNCDRALPLMLVVRKHGKMGLAPDPQVLGSSAGCSGCISDGAEMLGATQACTYTLATSRSAAVEQGGGERKTHGRLDSFDAGLGLRSHEEILTRPFERCQVRKNLRGEPFDQRRRRLPVNALTMRGPGGR